MSNRLVPLGYLAVAIGMVVALVAGDGAPLSLGWMLAMVDAGISGAWQAAPELVVLSIAVVGGLIGYRIAKREATDQQALEKSTAQMRELIEREMTKEPDRP